jgi:F0F1-type ATP synthase delta subunit
MYSDISQLRTKEELELFKQKLEEDGKKLFVDGVVSPELIKHQKDYLKKLEAELEKIKIVRLTLAFDPTEEFLDKITDWIQKNVGQGYVLEVNIEPAIIAGARIEFEGKFFDFSLQKSLKTLTKNEPLE